MVQNFKLTHYLHSWRVLGRQPVCGERHGQSKLTADQVASIRIRKGMESSPRIAREFGVSTSVILDIWNDKLWKEHSTVSETPKHFP